MKKIITITFASLLFATAINAQQTAPVAETKKTAPVVHSATHEKRAAERAGRNKQQGWGNMKSPAAGKK